MTAMLDMFRVTASTAADKEDKPEKVDSEWYAAFGRIWLDIEIYACEALEEKGVADDAPAHRMPRG